MEININPGIENTFTMTVEQQYTASAYGSGLIDVLATPAMIGFMEKTAQEAVQPFLPEGYITLGDSSKYQAYQGYSRGRKSYFPR